MDSRGRYQNEEYSRRLYQIGAFARGNEGLEHADRVSRHDRRRSQNEGFPSRRSQNEGFPSRRSQNEEYPSRRRHSQNEEYPSHRYHSQNEEYPSHRYYSQNEEYPSHRYHSQNEEYPSHRYQNEEYPSHRYQNEEYPSHRYQNEEYPSHRYQNEVYPSHRYQNEEYSRRRYRNEGFSMGFGNFAQGKEASDVLVDMGPNFPFVGFAQGNEASEEFFDMGSGSHMGAGEQLHPECMITRSALKDKNVTRSKKKKDKKIKDCNSFSIASACVIPKWVLDKMRETTVLLKKDHFLLAKYRSFTPQEQMYYRQRIQESDGFDVGDFPDNIDPWEMRIRPMNLHLFPPESEKWKNLEDYSKLALCEYNNTSETKYQFSWLLKANCRSGWPVVYYITFQANDVACSHSMNFQACLSITLYETAVLLCRPEQ